MYNYMCSDVKNSDSV